MFKSQFRQHLYPFLRKNELFGNYPIVTLSRQTMQRIVWQDVDIATDTAPYTSGKTKSFQKNVTDIDYGWQGDKLFIHLQLKRALDEDLGISIYLFGHDKKTEFAKMPKIRVTLGILGAQTFDLQKHIVVSGTTVKNEKQTLIISVPLAIMGNPKYILTSAYSRAGDLAFSETAWRILELE